MRTTTPATALRWSVAPPPLDARAAIAAARSGPTAAEVRRRLAFASGFGFALSALALVVAGDRRDSRANRPGCRSVVQDVRALDHELGARGDPHRLPGGGAGSPRFLAFVLVWIVGRGARRGHAGHRAPDRRPAARCRPGDERVLVHGRARAQCAAAARPGLPDRPAAHPQRDAAGPCAGRAVEPGAHLLRLLDQGQRKRCAQRQFVAALGCRNLRGDDRARAVCSCS